MAGPPPIPVSIISLTQLLATRLGITLTTSTNFWTKSELELYVRQAIREFQVLTGYWRQRVQLLAQPGVAFYDIHVPSVPLTWDEATNSWDSMGQDTWDSLGLVSGPAAIPITVTDADILAQVSAHLLESNGINFEVNTTQFNSSALIAAFDQRREEMLGATRLIVQEYKGYAPGPSPGSSRITLSSGVIQIHRMEWLDLTNGLTWNEATQTWDELDKATWDSLGLKNQWNLISRTDELGAYGWTPGWAQEQAPVPTGYSVAVTRPFEVQLIEPPAGVGKVSILITACQPYAYTGGAQPLGMPDDSAYALPWGILASVLNQDAQSRDYKRAMYAQKRFRDAISVLKTFPCVMNAYPGGTQYLPSTLFALDHWRSGWRNESGAPDAVAMAGRNLVALSPVPDKAYNIPMDCIVNSPASIALDTVNFDLPGDIVTAILNNAYHLACFKLGGVEFEGTKPLYQEFIDVAEDYSHRSLADAINWKALRDVDMKEEAERPYEAETVEA